VDLPDEIAAAQRTGPRGVGLLRTEFLLTGHATLPSESEQAAYFRRVAEGPAIRSWCRTYDLGGDKFPRRPSARRRGEPGLGWRANPRVPR